jgi:hypothetical protein
MRRLKELIDWHLGIEISFSRGYHMRCGCTGPESYCGNEKRSSRWYQICNGGDRRGR